MVLSLFLEPTQDKLKRKKMSMQMTPAVVSLRSSLSLILTQKQMPLYVHLSK